MQKARNSHPPPPSQRLPHHPLPIPHSGAPTKAILVRIVYPFADPEDRDASRILGLLWDRNRAQVRSVPSLPSHAALPREDSRHPRSWRKSLTAQARHPIGKLQLRMPRPTLLSEPLYSRPTAAHELCRFGQEKKKQAFGRAHIPTTGMKNVQSLQAAPSSAPGMVEG